MSQISAQDVKRLRETTGVGMMDCKRALEEAGGDFDAAIEILRKKGQKVAAKRADREATEGVVATATTPDRKAGALVEVNSETDFVARNEEFTTFAQRIADLVLAERPADMDALRALPLDGRTVGDAVTDMTGKIGEKIDVRRFAIIEADGDGEVVDYVHPGAKLGVLVEMAGSGDLQAVGRDVAMQAAAMNPVAATRDEVPEEVKAKELEIGREAARNEGKPEQILDKIAQGKLERYFKDNVLVEQPFVKDASVSVKQMLEQAGAEVRRFVRFALGD
ncbi:MAG TPA: translation elongation factor Ts [Rubricoccaceae bacterium]|nr:translation elongation factor Ts [Rubricoccaceae bacterium]